MGDIVFHVQLLMESDVSVFVYVVDENVSSCNIPFLLRAEIAYRRSTYYVFFHYIVGFVQTDDDDALWMCDLLVRFVDCVWAYV